MALSATSTPSRMSNGVTWIQPVATKAPVQQTCGGDTHLLYGSFVKLPQGFEGEIVAKSDEFKAVVISGSLKYDNVKTLDSGSYFTLSKGAHSRIENEGNKPSIVYIRATSPYQVKDSKW